jgi:protein-tyrosine phosphatase
LAAGQVVAVPTEATYELFVAATQPQSRQSFVEIPAPAWAGLLSSAEALHDWVDALSPRAERLIRRGWPGPLILELVPAPTGLVTCVPADLHADGFLRFRRSAAPMVAALLDQLREPVLAWPTECATAEAVMDQWGTRVDLVINAGPCRYGQPPTTVRLAGDAITITRPGVVSAAELTRIAACVVVFVCTGNTCRSPLAEVLCKQRLAQRLGCTPAELPSRGWYVLSAGLAAGRGAPAAEHAIAVAQTLGADLSQHTSRPLTEDLLAQADYVLTMTRGHLHALQPHLADLVAVPRLLCPQGGDLPDPIGGPPEVYAQCAQTIWQHLDPLLAEWQLA